jgi:hypothetical protein
MCDAKLCFYVDLYELYVSFSRSRVMQCLRCLMA